MPDRYYDLISERDCLNQLISVLSVSVDKIEDTDICLPSDSSYDSVIHLHGSMRKVLDRLYLERKFVLTNLKLIKKECR